MPETRLSKKSKIKKLKLSDVTDEMRRKFHVCDHDKVGYSEISKLALFMLKRSKQDAKDIKKITEILTWQKQHIEDLKKINMAMVDKYEDQFEEYEKANEELKKANTQLILNVEELKKRLFGSFERKLKDFALRPDRKKDN